MFSSGFLSDFLLNLHFVAYIFLCLFFFWWYWCYCLLLFVDLFFVCCWFICFCWFIYLFLHFFISFHRSAEFVSFVDTCLEKNARKRTGARELLAHPFLNKRSGVTDMRGLIELHKKIEDEEDENNVQIVANWKAFLEKETQQAGDGGDGSDSRKESLNLRSSNDTEDFSTVIQRVNKKNAFLCFFLYFCLCVCFFVFFAFFLFVFLFVCLFIYLFVFVCLFIYLSISLFVLFCFVLAMTSLLAISFFSTDARKISCA